MMKNVSYKKKGYNIKRGYNITIFFIKNIILNTCLIYTCISIYNQNNFKYIYYYHITLYLINLI